MAKQSGVDPGSKGAIATLDIVEQTLRIDSMPVIKFRRKTTNRLVTLIDAKALAAIVDVHDADHCVLEEVGVRPDEGSVSAFSFGRTFGTIHTVLLMCGMEVTLVLPNNWKRETKTPSDKNGAVHRADALFPRCKYLWRGPRGGLQDDRAEAAIMALYGLVLRGVPLPGAFEPVGD